MTEHPHSDFRQYTADGLLRDGSSIHIRAIRPDDKARLVDHFSRLSAQSVYFRFFRSKKRLTDDELQHFTEVDFVRNVGLVATLRHGDEERIIGVGRYAMAGDDHGAVPLRAEVAFAVADDFQGRGVGTLLLEHLAPIARANGITEFEADVLGENNRMLDVFRGSGFRVKRSLEAGVFHVIFPTEETEQSVEAHEQRERYATAQSVRAFLNPGSVAIVGASRHPNTIGGALLANVKRCGFTGPIYPINPQATEIDGLTVYPSIRAVGAPIDLAVIAVPAPAVEAAVAECADAGVRGVVVISSGFAEVSEAGRAAQGRLTELVRSSGMRMVGPNCMGVLNTDPAVSLNATFAPSWPPVGNVGMLSQSGALGLIILDYVRRLNIGISTFVSVGNKADVSGNDLLSYWADDPHTHVIVLYLESFGNPRTFARITPDIARQKPIVAVKSGRSAAGTRAASSHSAALASLDVAVDALFEQAGVIRTNTLEELFDVAALLANQPLPGGSRVGVVTNAGGPGILLADACEARALTLPELQAHTLATLRGFLPAQAGLGNPIDMIAAASPEQYARTIEAVGADANVDSLVVIYIPPMVSKPEEIAAAIAHGAGRVPVHKPVLSVFMSSKGAPPMLSAPPRGALPSYSFPENAAQALAAAYRYARWRQRPRGTPLKLGPFAEGAVRAVIDRVLAEAAGPCWLQPRDMVTVLRAAGITFAAMELTTPAEAVATAERLGYPLVAKAVAPDLVHKSDVGAVILGLESADAVAAAVDTLGHRMRAIGAQLEEILLQREVRGGIEALVGVTTDPTFGPLVVCGLGGVLVELLRDVSFHLTPVSDVDAAEMLEKLRAGRLLDGYRGAPAGDRAALLSVIMRVSALVEIVPELRELDLNPVKVLAPGHGAVAVDGRIRVGRLKT
ncbi:MAG TPA: GNAT family N-acetyltransferase [Candidatus Acidoferrales bacterium]|nr:GNAT family N-acetyltransferase [Candidatus Acidoferrales bacterium]